MVYWNERKQLIGLRTHFPNLLMIEDSIFMVLTDEWELVGEL